MQQMIHLKLRHIPALLIWHLMQLSRALSLQLSQALNFLHRNAEPGDPNADVRPRLVERRARRCARLASVRVRL